MMRTIGAISDTHGLLRPQALAALAGCDPIIHAGDVGSPDVLARLGVLAPVHAVRGNVDHGAWSANLPVTRRIEIDGFRIYVLHILAELDPQAAVGTARIEKECAVLCLDLGLVRMTIDHRVDRYSCSPIYLMPAANQVATARLR